MRKRIVIIMILCLVLISILLVWWMKGSSESEREILNSDSSGSEALDSGGNGGAKGWLGEKGWNGDVRENLGIDWMEQN